jgi:hypothetical protein
MGCCTLSVLFVSMTSCRVADVEDLELWLSPAARHREFTCVVSHLGNILHIHIYYILHLPVTALCLPRPSYPIPYSSNTIEGIQSMP